MRRLRFYATLARVLWLAAIRWPLNPDGARVFWLLFLIGWRERRLAGVPAGELGKGQGRGAGTRREYA